MLDFPNSPTTGTIFSSGGMLWRYDGTKWVQASGMLAIPDAPSDGNTYGRKSAAWNSVDAMLAPVAANANAALNDTGRNLVHNGQFNIAQRGAGPFAANVGYTADRWVNPTGGDTNNTTIVALADTDRTAIGDEAALYAAQNAFTGLSGAGNYIYFIQRCENVRRVSGKTCTISFWAKATSGTPRIGVSLYQNFGSGGTPSGGVYNTFGATAALSTTWTRYTMTGAVASSSGKTFGTTAGTDFFELDLWLSAGSGNNANAGNIGVQSGTVLLYGVQLEIGSVATPLAKRDPADELALCQRFYQTGTAYLAANGSAGGTNAVAVAFCVWMRANPTIAFGTVTYNNASGISNLGGIGNGFICGALVAATGFASFNAPWTASADL